MAGRFGGRRISAPKGDRTRPTSDRVREALFSALGSFTADARVLDLCAGTGALGIEALSRGAAHATFVERDPSALRVIRANLDTLQVDDATKTLVLGDAIRFVASTSSSWSLVLCDPPYDDAIDIFTGLFAHAPRCLDSDGLMVLEHRTGVDLMLPATLRLERDRKYGDTVLSWVKHAKDPR